MAISSEWPDSLLAANGHFSMAADTMKLIAFIGLFPTNQMTKAHALFVGLLTGSG